MVAKLVSNSACMWQNGEKVEDDILKFLFFFFLDASIHANTYNVKFKTLFHGKICILYFKDMASESKTVSF